MDPKYEILIDEKSENMLKILDYKILGIGDEKTVKKLIARNKELDAEIMEFIFKEALELRKLICSSVLNDMDQEE